MTEVVPQFRSGPGTLATADQAGVPGDVSSAEVILPIQCPWRLNQSLGMPGTI